MSTTYVGWSWEDLVHRIRELEAELADGKEERDGYRQWHAKAFDAVGPFTIQDIIGWKARAEKAEARED